MDLPFPHKKEILLSNYSTFGIGGAARYFAEVHTADSLQEILSFAHQTALRTMILGKGSNSLFDDRGFNGLVILNRIDYLNHNGNRMNVGSGYSFARLGGVTARLGLAGLEFASGIPATVGGAIYMNAGANGKETADTLLEVDYVTEKGERIRFAKSQLQFSYRTSPFQKMQGAILEGVFQLTASLEVKKQQKEILDYRLKTQPYKEKSAGCAFRNPEGFAAGQLIDACGLKGTSIGGASVSSTHANFIINQGHGSAQDVLNLIRKIKEQVYEKKGILLEEEIRYIPYDI